MDLKELYKEETLKKLYVIMEDNDLFYDEEYVKWLEYLVLKGGLNNI